MLLLLMSFMACKKNNNQPEVFDITQYAIVGKTVHNHLTTSATEQYVLPFVITFETPSKSRRLLLSRDDEYAFTYTDGILTQGHRKFAINEKELTAYDLSDASEIFKLVKVPSGNVFSGNSYTGNWKRRLSSLLVYASLKFSDYQFGEASINEPVLNKNYTLIKNIAGVHETAEDAYFWVQIDGKVEASKSSYTTGTVYLGSFTKK